MCQHLKAACQHLEAACQHLKAVCQHLKAVCWMERLELKGCQGSMGSLEGRKVRKEMRGLQAHLDRMARKVRRGR